MKNPHSLVEKPLDIVAPEVLDAPQNDALKIEKAHGQAMSQAIMAINTLLQKHQSQLLKVYLKPQNYAHTIDKDDVESLLYKEDRIGRELEHVDTLFLGLLGVHDMYQKLNYPYAMPIIKNHLDSIVSWAQEHPLDHAEESNPDFSLVPANEFKAPLSARLEKAIARAEMLGCFSAKYNGGKYVPETPIDGAISDQLVIEHTPATVPAPAPQIQGPASAIEALDARAASPRTL